MNILELLKEKWITDGVVLYPPEPRINVISSFRKLGVSPSEEVVSLYSEVGGMEDMGNEYFRLWTLNEIVIENSKPDELVKTKNFGVLFGDYLINSWCYRLVNESSLHSSVYIDHFGVEEAPELKSNTLEGFLKIVLDDQNGELY